MYSKALSLLALVGVAHSHMSMYFPAPLGADPSINKQSTIRDKQFNYPLGCCGSDGGPSKPGPGICRGHLDKYDTETAQVTWQSGQDAYFQLTDYSYDPAAPGSTHSGGSCQVGFSVDKGKTWKVAASYHGNCPKGSNGSPEAQRFDFKVPTNMPEGDALFSWTWLNREHEAFHNCAKVHIGAGGSNSSTPSQPAQSSSPVTQPKSSQSATQPKVPAQSPTTPDDDDDDDDTPVATPRPTSTIRGGRRPTSSTRTRKQATSTRYHAQATAVSDDSDDDSDSDSETTWHPHRHVDEKVRRFEVDSHRCECRQDDITLCSCEPFEQTELKRGDVERKAVRMLRRDQVKRADGCDWATAPAMEVSYYTIDAKCAPGIKSRITTSDTFELGWPNVNCGVVQGKGEYPIKMLDCGSYPTS